MLLAPCCHLNDSVALDYEATWSNATDVYQLTDNCYEIPGALLLRWRLSS
jgi:hypothetical protein